MLSDSKREVLCRVPLAAYERSSFKFSSENREMSESVRAGASVVTTTKVVGTRSDHHVRNTCAEHLISKLCVALAKYSMNKTFIANFIVNKTFIVQIRQPNVWLPSYKYGDDCERERDENTTKLWIVC